MDNNMMQMMMQMMMQNQQMMNMMMAQAMQQGTQTQTPMMSTVAQNNETMSAQPSDSMNAQIVALQNQVDALQKQLATTTQELQQARQEVAKSKSVVKDAKLDDLTKKVQALEQISGRSIEEVTKDIEQGKTIIARKGASAHEAFKQMIDEGKLSKDTTMYADSEDILEAIEEAKDTDKTVEEILEQAKNETGKPIQMVEFNKPNEFGF